MKFELIDQAPGFRIGRIGALVVSAFTDGGASLEALACIDRVHSAHLRTYPHFTTLALVSGVKLSPPPSGVRERSAELDVKFDVNVFGSAVVIETKGLAAVVARSFLATYSMLSPRSRPFKVSSTLEEATTWLQSLPEQTDEFKNERALPALVREIQK